MRVISAIKKFVSYPDPDIDLTWRDFAIEFLWIKRCGLISICWGRWAFHVGVRPSHWKWGHSFEAFRVHFDHWGLGPVFLLTRLS